MAHPTYLRAGAARCAPGCRRNGGNVPVNQCPRCSSEDAASAYYRALMRLDRRAR